MAPATQTHCISLDVASLKRRAPSPFKAGHVSPSSAATFTLKVLRLLGAAETARPSEELRQFLARCSELGRRGLARLRLPEASVLVRSLHHFLAAAEAGGDCQELCLELMAFVCGKDEDLECATEIRQRYPVDELWNLMMDADEQFHQAHVALTIM